MPTMRYYVDVAMALTKGGQTIALWPIGSQPTAILVYVSRISGRSGGDALLAKLFNGLKQ